ncbi:MAG: hypothetical protein NXY57DRAFT_129690 [Lentinula lateritia]|uniref:Uncharacterized protein n=1 Tax=Lentinula lateritia TaxID=40482 RepID=A0ABQ8V1T2_9AGAR|nr:MAG: hypothetical protein NXY57DRAFT_129690 [Lentinula lateritia]KAJ4469336.1 hypothetical protein C8R41DRAFT_870982 [Lentinula lateritia]
MHFRAVCLFILGLLAVVSQAAPGVPGKSKRPAVLPIIIVKFHLPNGHEQEDPETNRRRLVHFFHEYHEDILIEKPATQIISHDGHWPSEAATEIGMWWIVSDRRTAQQVAFDQEKWNWGTMEKDEGWEWE